MIEVFVVLLWFYEGDSNLVDSFIGVTRNYESALELTKDRELLTEDEFILEGRDRQPKDWGSYGSVSKYEIRKITI